MIKPFKTPVIPEMTDPLGKYWDAPSRDEIYVTLSHAWMSQKAFERLHTYQHSMPTGVYVGKMWKLQRKGRWYLAWFGKDPDPHFCTNNYLRIGIC